MLTRVTAATYLRCQRPLRLFRQQGVCAECKPALIEVKQRAVPAARKLLLDGQGPFTLTWDAVLADFQQAGFPPHAGLGELDKLSLNWLSRYVAFVSSDGVLTSDERRSYYAAIQRLALNPAKVQAMTASVERAYALTEIRAGRLQAIRPPDVHLPIDELCYYATTATRWKPVRNGVYSTQGQLILSSKGIAFIASEMGGQMPWRKVMRLYPQGVDQVVVEGSAAS